MINDYDEMRLHQQSGHHQSWISRLAYDRYAHTRSRYFQNSKYTMEYLQVLRSKKPMFSQEAAGAVAMIHAEGVATFTPPRPGDI